MLYSGTDPESYITEYTLVYEEICHRVYFRIRRKQTNNTCRNARTPPSESRLFVRKSSYGDPLGLGVSYERGTPVGPP